ncbi:MAG TPA: carboxypeptidase-like regulatory domain-containing protein, partial [Candidatus Marinimicrobia bacterium]|nr:carboxypeptidase-like regulatory domain-containing protein [Candidatus Neomarinimicrobiota bacterium]
MYIEDFGIGAASQVDGRFELHNLPYDKVSLTISMIGFRDVTKSLKLDEDINDIGNVFMVTDTIKIEEIVVDAHHELQPKSFSSNIYITGGQYHSNLKSSLALTLEEETGLSIRSMGQGTTQPVLRGYSG